jgi:acyl-CoA reductase-like NAD-dependent aldehyde dehydrogenase
MFTLPVISIAEANSVDEVVELANASDYSLAGALFTRDVNAAFDVGGRIRAGMNVCLAFTPLIDDIYQLLQES